MSSYRSYTDEELVSLIADNDHAAYTEIYDRYAGVLYIHVRKKINDREAARDLVHDLFVSLWKNRTMFTAKSQLSNYLYVAIRYKAINWLVRERRLAEFEAAMKDIIASEQPLADYLLRERELKQLIEAEARCLPKKMREIFYMSRELHLTHKEIAARLDLSPATVKKQVNNALKILRIKLEAFFAIIWFLNL